MSFEPSMTLVTSVNIRKDDKVLLVFLEVFNHSCRFAATTRVVVNLNYFVHSCLFSLFQTKENPEAPNAPQGCL